MYLIYLYRVIHFYITLRRLGWLGLGWDHVSFGGCPSMYLPVSRSTVDRHIGHYVGRESTEYRPSAGRELVEYRSRACRVSTDMLATRGRFSRSVDSLSIVDRYFADGSWLHRRLFSQEDSPRINLDSRQHIYAITSV